MKRGTMIGIGVLVFLVLISFIMLRSSSPDADIQTPQIEETNNEPFIEQEQPSLSSDSDVFNEFDSALEGLS